MKIGEHDDDGSVRQQGALNKSTVCAPIEDEHRICDSMTELSCMLGGVVTRRFACRSRRCAEHGSALYFRLLGHIAAMRIVFTA